MTVSEVTKLKNLKDENAKLKGLVAELSPENPVQKDVIKTFLAWNEKKSDRSYSETFQIIAETNL